MLVFSRFVAALLVALSAISASCATTLAQSAFYSVDGVDLGAYSPGSVIRREKIEGAPAYRILYRSTGLHDEPTDLATLMTDDLGTGGGNNITATTLWSWSRVYGAPMDAVVTPQGDPMIHHLANLCIERWFDVFTRRGPTHALEKSFLNVDSLADREPSRACSAKILPALSRRTRLCFSRRAPPTSLVRPSVTEDYRAQLCKAGDRVDFVLVPNVGHAFIAGDVAGAAVRWMADRFAGAPAPSHCGPQ